MRMTRRFFTVICAFGISTALFAQASGGQITRKSPSIYQNKRTMIKQVNKEEIELANYPPDAQYCGEKNKIPTVICYKKGVYTITKSQVYSLDSIAKMMIEDKYLKILIEGYSSLTRNPTSEKKLSEQRAVFLQSTLVRKYKIAKDRILANGMGGSSQCIEDIGTNDVVILYTVPYNTIIESYHFSKK